MTALHVKISDKDIFPGSFPHSLYISAGDDIILHMGGDSLYITTPNQELRKLQDMTKTTLDNYEDDYSWVDEMF